MAISTEEDSFAIELKDMVSISIKVVDNMKVTGKMTCRMGTVKKSSKTVQAMKASFLTDINKEKDK